MGKKKHKVRKHQQDPGACESSEDELLEASGKSQCPHIIRAVNISGVKKIFKNKVVLGECQLCANLPVKPDSINECEVVVWLCLQCGNQGCDRNSPGQHALLHYQTPRSDSHSVALNLTSWSIWCYDCDEEVMPDWSKKLLECIDYLKRHSKPTNSLPNSITSCPDSGEQASDLLSPVTIASEITSPSKEENIKSVTKSGGKSPDISHSCIEISEKKKKALDNSILESLPKVKGLTNLGNTCFFNAVIQSLSQTHVLSQLLDLLCTKGSTVLLDKTEVELANCEQGINGKLQLDPINITLAEGGPLTQSLSLLLKDMQSMGKSRTTSPGQLLGQVCKRAPQFRGSMQQDGHELLRHLIDGLKSEDTKRYQAGILKAFGLSEKVNPKTVDEVTAAKVKAYGRLVQQTLVDQIFSGQLISTVLCEECRMSSQVFEPFLDLSLQVAEEKTVRPGLVKRVLAEPSLGCFGKTDDKQTSKFQERKSKQQARRDAKLQRNKAKQIKKRTLSINQELTDEECKVPEEVNDNSIPDSESVKSNSVDKEASEPSDADVEDNLESGSTSSLSNNGCPAPAIVGGKDFIENWPTNPNLNIQDSELPDASAGDSLNELYHKVQDVRIRDEILVGENILGSPSNGESLPTDWTNCNGSHCKESGEEKHDDEKEQNGHQDDEEREQTQKQQSLAKLEWMTKSLTTLAPRYHPSSQECSIHSCLNQFTAPELLTGQNKFGCENCTRIKQKKNGEISTDGEKIKTVYTNASKQLLIFNPPAILTLHLKRFQQVGSSLRKVNRHVDFPIMLDLAPFCSSICLGLPTLKKYQKQVLYSLYAVVEHSGRLTGGHYTAYIKVRPPNANLQAFLNMRPANHYDINKLVDEMHNKLYSGAALAEGHSGSDDTDDGLVKQETVPNRWYHVSDSHVTESSESSVLKCQAYLLFYERIV